MFFFWPIDFLTFMGIIIIAKGKWPLKKGFNPHADKSKRQPNMVQNAFSELFNDIHTVREDITKQSRNIQAINKKLLRRLNKI